MKYSDFKNVPKTFAMYCGLCGFNVPCERKYIFKLFQRRPTKKSNGEIFGYQIFIGFVCPECGTETEFNYWSTGDCSDILNELNVYTETRNDEPEKAA